MREEKGTASIRETLLARMLALQILKETLRIAP
jgi:hypothetical protein